MIAITTINLIGLISNFSLFIFSAALAVIALWQNYRRRLNQYLALMMIFMAIWGLVSSTQRAPAEFPLDTVMAVNAGTVAYFLAVLMLVWFITELENTPMKPQTLRFIRLVETGLIVGLIAWSLSGQFWEERSIQSDGSLHLQLSQSALLMSCLLMIWHIYVFSTLLHRSTSRLSTSIIAALPLLLGGLAIISNLPQAAALINHIAAIISILLLARILLNDQLFNPLIDLYQRLSIKNNELHEASRLKSEFLANMSHELRTPLNSIIGYTELLQGGMYGELTGQQADRLEKIGRNGHQLLQLINNVLDLSKIDAGRLELLPAHVSAVHLLDEALQTIEVLAGEKGLTIKRDYQNLPMLYVDEVRARQVVVNIIANAIEFTKHGEIRVSGYVDLNHNQVVLMVADSRMGISREDAERIKQAFEGIYTGAGLGLAISKRLAELHGGQVWFKSMAGQGSSFYIRLPAAHIRRQEAEIALTAASETDGDERLVLVIDDKANTFEIFRDHLDGSGYYVVGALSGYEGVLRSRELHPHCILLSMAIDGDGYSILNTLKNDETLQKIPVIAIMDNRAAHIPSEAISTIHKPVTRRSLLNALQVVNTQSDSASNTHRLDV